MVFSSWSGLAASGRIAMQRGPNPAFSDPFRRPGSRCAGGFLWGWVRWQKQLRREYQFKDSPMS